MSISFLTVPGQHLYASEKLSAGGSPPSDIGDKSATPGVQISGLLTISGLTASLPAGANRAFAFNDVSIDL
jgi:hypothetical protein